MFGTFPISKIIENTLELMWLDKNCTFAAALESALSVTTNPVQYDEIMSCSGLAFRVRWYQGEKGVKWCPTSPVAEFPEEFNVFEMFTGWNLYNPFKKTKIITDKKGITEYLELALTSINLDLPVIVMDHEMNVGIIAGYENSGKTLFLRSYAAERDEKYLQTSPDKLNQWMLLLEPKRKKIEIKDQLKFALQNAINNWYREPLDNPNPDSEGKYWYGQQAFEKWMDDIDIADQVSEVDRSMLMLVNWWCFCNLQDSRSVAARFLTTQSQNYSGDICRKLEEVAKVYEAEANEFMSYYGTQDVFFGPWTNKTLADWTPEVRAREKSIIKSTMDRETILIEVLAEILKTI